MKTETGLRIEFQSEMDTKVFNEQGEIDIDYVLWLESKVMTSQSQPTDEIENYVIMHGNKVFRGLYFTSVKLARNYIKMQYPKRHFKELSENKFTDTQYGATFEILVLQKHS